MSQDHKIISTDNTQSSSDWVSNSHWDDDLAKGMGLGLMTCMMVVFINNCFGDRWAYFELSSYLWIFGGLVARYIILSEEKTIEITPTPTLIKPTIVPEVKKKKKVRYYDL